MELNIDQLVREAAHLDTREANDRLYLALRGQPVFFNVNWRKKIDPSTGKETSSPSSSPLLCLPSGDHAFMAYTTQENPALQAPFGGGPWEKVLGQLLRMPQADGLILSNAQGLKVALSKERAEQVLRLFEQAPSLPQSAGQEP